MLDGWMLAVGFETGRQRREDVSQTYALESNASGRNYLSLLTLYQRQSRDSP
jgi:hypothetical protein